MSQIEPASEGLTSVVFNRSITLSSGSGTSSHLLSLEINILRAISDHYCNNDPPKRKMPEIPNVTQVSIAYQCDTMNNFLIISGVRCNQRRGVRSSGIISYPTGALYVHLKRKMICVGGAWRSSTEIDQTFTVRI